MADRIKTTVLRWFDAVGFGFLKNPDPTDERDVYVAVDDLPPRAGSTRHLREGETVECEIILTPKGLQATDLVIAATEPQPANT